MVSIPLFFLGFEQDMMGQIWHSTYRHNFTLTFCLKKATKLVALDHLEFAKAALASLRKCPNALCA